MSPTPLRMRTPAVAVAMRPRRPPPVESFLANIFVTVTP
jgi:hypothetical protein